MIRFLFCWLLLSQMGYAQQRPLRITTGPAFNGHDFSWSIAGTIQGTSPNILSELKYENIKAAGMYISADYMPLKWLEIKGTYERYGVFAGRSVDRDFYGDDRTTMVYDETFDSNKGFLQVIKAAAFIKPVNKERYSIKAGPVYVNMSQRYYMRSEHIARLNSTYQSDWSGPGIAVGAEGKLGRAFTAELLGYYCFVNYKGVADWNMKKEFQHPVSFRQEAQGVVLETQLGLRYRLNSSYLLLLQGTLGRSWSRKGVDVAYFSDDTQASTQLNGTQRYDAGLKLGIAIEL